MRETASITKVLLFTAAVACAALPPAAGAAEGDKYWGAKTGLVMVDIDGVDADVDDIIPITGVLGYGIGPDLAIEGELTLTLAGGDIDAIDGEAEVMAIGGFLAFRPAIDNNKYFKGKIGLVNGEAEVCAAGGCISDDETAIAFGAGIGFRTSPMWTWEVEYTIYSFDDVDVDYLSVGATVPF